MPQFGDGALLQGIAAVISATVFAIGTIVTFFHRKRIGDWWADRIVIITQRDTAAARALVAEGDRERALQTAGLADRLANVSKTGYEMAMQRLEELEARYTELERRYTDLATKYDSLGVANTELRAHFTALIGWSVAVAQYAVFLEGLVTGAKLDRRGRTMPPVPESLAEQVAAHA
jgi:hypothetical protein